MSTQLIALGRRLFPERQFLVHNGQRVRTVALPGWFQAGALAVAIGMICGIGGLAGAYHNLHRAIHRKEAEISMASARATALATLRQELATTDKQYFAMSDQFDEMQHQLDAAVAENDTLRTSIEAAEARTVVLDKERLALDARLHGAEQALTSKSGNLSQLNKQLTDNRTELADAEGARNTLQTKLHQLQADSENSSGRTAELKLALETRERQLHDIAAERDRLRAQVEQQAPAIAEGTPPHASYGDDLERLIASTGVDLDKLLGRFGSLPAGEGGPFVALGPDHTSPADQRARDEELRSLARSLPLAAPLVHYRVESGFGPRIDPFRGRRAFHDGIDLSAPYRSPVYSTAPGTITFTGVKDDYGRVVEITHAHGIVTRYAHLHRILVALGQKVGVHQEIAELGSTGRSTGPHVHYEVLIDGTAVDPAKFMKAGKGVELITTK
jgi:murein DD-endopeptidase MepM/ murein hydrolase activator NlpD